MVGGTELLRCWSSVCDLALGPLISLVIYDSRKARRKLIMRLHHRRRRADRRAGLRRLRTSPGTRPVYVAFSIGPPRNRHARATSAIRSSPRRAIPQYREAAAGRAAAASAIERAGGGSATMRCSSRSVGNEEHARPKFYVPLRDRARQHPPARASDHRRAREASIRESKPLLDDGDARSHAFRRSACAGCRFSIVRDSGPR